MTVVWRGLVVAAALAILAGCGQSGSGPRDVAWDKDTCERCQQVISAKKFAAQARDDQGKYHLFDDFGDMVLWLDEQKLLDGKRLLYVTDVDSGVWIEARKARYSRGFKTPRGFGIAGHALFKEGDISFGQAVAAILSRK
ncbi:MAG: hypothetical protein HQL56_03070 [Magnetococcales bacterium]|nr:hypothetical protein [Magnetococcales bacterium]